MLIWQNITRNQLSGATNNNVTLNLSGILILGMTLSAAVCVWTYSVTLLERRGQGGLLSKFSKVSITAALVFSFFKSLTRVELAIPPANDLRLVLSHFIFDDI